MITASYSNDPVLEALIYGDTLPDVPWSTCWWRQRLRLEPDGGFYTMELDDPEKPTQLTVIWHDSGLQDTLAPYAVRISVQEDRDHQVWAEQMFIARVLPNPARRYLDILWHEPPTAGLWASLTQPGQHVHPDDRKEIMQLRKEWCLQTLRRMRLADDREDLARLSDILEGLLF